MREKVKDGVVWETRQELTRGDRGTGRRGVTGCVTGVVTGRWQEVKEVVSERWWERGET